MFFRFGNLISSRCGCGLIRIRRRNTIWIPRRKSTAFFVRFLLDALTGGLGAELIAAKQGFVPDHLDFHGLAVHVDHFKPLAARELEETGLLFFVGLALAQNIRNNISGWTVSILALERNGERMAPRIQHKNHHALANPPFEIL